MTWITPGLYWCVSFLWENWEKHVKPHYITSKWSGEGSITLVTGLFQPFPYLNLESDWISTNITLLVEDTWGKLTIFLEMTVLNHLSPLCCVTLDSNQWAYPCFPVDHIRCQVQAEKSYPIPWINAWVPWVHIKFESESFGSSVLPINEFIHAFLHNVHIICQIPWMDAWVYIRFISSVNGKSWVSGSFN